MAPKGKEIRNATKICKIFHATALLEELELNDNDQSNKLMLLPHRNPEDIVKRNILEFRTKLSVFRIWKDNLLFL